MFSKIRKYFNWDESYIFEEICQVFAVITVINSFMMVFNVDTPKDGAFAYIHLLSRLFIISIIILIFDFCYIKQEIVQMVKAIKDTSKLSLKEAEAKFVKSLLEIYLVQLARCLPYQ